MPFISPANLDGSRWVVSSVSSLSGAGLRHARLLPAKSVLVSCIGILGKVGQSPVPVATNQQLNAIIPGPGVDAHFLYYAAHRFKNQLEQEAGLQVVPIVNKTRFSTVPLQLPPLSEQQRIAEILDTLDEAIRKTEQLIAKLKQVKQGFLHDLLTRGIDDNGELRDPARHPEQFKDSPLGLVPLEWEVTSIADLCASVIDCPHSTPIFMTDGLLVARTSNIKAGRFDGNGASKVSEGEYARRIVRLEPRPGDVIFTREAPVGEAFVIPDGMRICLGQRVMLLRPNPRRLDPHYLVAQVYSGAVARRIELLTGGTTNPHLNVADIRDFPIPAPPVHEQYRIASALGDHDRWLDHEAIAVGKLRLIKVGLMEDLLTGRVRVPVGVGKS